MQLIYEEDYNNAISLQRVEIMLSAGGAMKVVIVPTKDRKPGLGI